MLDTRCRSRRHRQIQQLASFESIHTATAKLQRRRQVARHVTRHARYLAASATKTSGHNVRTHMVREFGVPSCFRRRNQQEPLEDGNDLRWPETSIRVTSPAFRADSFRVAHGLKLVRS